MEKDKLKLNNCEEFNLGVFIFDHPLIHTDLTKLRDKSTSSAEFRQTAKKISTLMGGEILSNVQIVSHSVSTPLSSYVGKRIASPAPVFVSILRAGSIMVGGVVGPLP